MLIFITTSNPILAQNCGRKITLYLLFLETPWGEILLHRDKKSSSGQLEPPIGHQFVFVFSTQWRREIQLSD